MKPALPFPEIGFEPELIIKGTPLDIELCGLLEEKQMDFIVLHANGEPLSFAGTPFDSSSARYSQKLLVDALNNRSKKSDWPGVFEARKAEICRQFKLPAETTAKDFHPEFTFKIHRVCTSYSEHTSAAMSLLETIDAKLYGWKLRRGPNGDFEALVWDRSAYFEETGKELPLVIAEAVRRLLLAQKEAAK